MDAYEATRVVFSRIQSVEPENAAKIMGLILLQDHGEKEMIRLAFGPEALLRSIVSKARKDLGLLPPSASTTPSAGSSPFLLSRQNSYSSSSSRLFVGGVFPPPPLTVASPSWAPPSSFNGVSDDIHMHGELVNPANQAPSSPFYGNFLEELQMEDQLSFADGPAGECRSPISKGDVMLSSYMGWGENGHRRSAASAELCVGSDPAGVGQGWRPCLYYARGYCKNGSSCRFMHGLQDDSAAPAGIDALVEKQHCQELLLSSKSLRPGGGASSQLMASAFPFSPASSVPLSPPNRCLSFLQSDNQRATAAPLLLRGDEKFMGRSRMERSNFASMENPGSRQIYLTFPADSSFREEDVSNYFSIYGPVHDVRIPYQQKRMFGFVTFIYPETVKVILAKGNPHFVCDARVLVKPYKEKSKILDKYRKLQPSERGDYSVCSTPPGLDASDPFDLQQFGARMLCYSSNEVLLRRKLEEQQQAAELQQAIELHGRRIMDLQMFDLKSRSAASLCSPTAAHINAATITPPAINTTAAASVHPLKKTHEEIQLEGNTTCTASGGRSAVAGEQQMNDIKAIKAGADKDESGVEVWPNVNDDSDVQDSANHNLPENPFASPTKACFDDTFAVERSIVASSQGGHGNTLHPTPLLPFSQSLNASFSSLSRFSCNHGAVGM